MDGGEEGGQGEGMAVFLMGSAHFQVPRIETPIARLEIFRSSHCGMHFAQYFRNRLELYFSVACLEALCGVT